MDIITFEGEKPGPALVALGGVHGNEPCGPEAVFRLIDGIEKKRIVLERGRLVCIPAVNELALKKNQRFVDVNLNRVMGDPDPRTHEGRLALELRPHLEGIDYLLDLHSYTAGGPPFVFGDEDKKTIAFASCLPAAAVLTGWTECYRRTWPRMAAPGIGTTEYARRHGAVAATFECGQHADPAAADNGYDALLAVLAHAGMADAGSITGDSGQPPHIRLRHIFVKERPGTLAEGWRHMQPIAKGDIYARYEDGSVQEAPMDGLVIMPAPAAAEGVEWGYIGIPA